jgi:hypothetical protein
VAEIAARQHGVVSRSQLAAEGLGRGAIEHRVRAGRLHPLHRGIYAVGHRRVIGPARWMAAVLACGQGALLSHRSAAALWGFRPTAASRIDVTVTGRTRTGQAGIAVHNVRSLHAEDRDERDGIPVTSAARTMLDLAEVLTRSRLERAFDEADRLERIDLGALSRLLDRSRGRHGLKPLAAILAERHRPVPETRSYLERSFLMLCREAGLPPPLVNSRIEGFEVDMAWPDRGLVVELDGFAFHRTRAAFERDRVRDAALQLAGLRVLRVTARRLGEEPATVAEAIRSLLAPRPRA